jgi:hypothetical protein
MILVRLPLRYPQLRDVSRLVTFQSCSVALIDTDKANIINLREKKYTRYRKALIFDSLCLLLDPDPNPHWINLQLTP